jgi:tetrahydromethanopterin S-methyltransferase subunit G
VICEEACVVDDLDNLVVAHLREMHAELQGISAKLEEHSHRLDKLDKRLDGSRPIIEHTLSLATLNQLKSGKLEARLDTTEAWQRAMNERLDRIERRLKKVEQELGG